MMTRWLLIAALAGAVAMSACSQKEEPVAEAPKAPATAPQAEMPPSHPPAGDAQGQMGQAPAAPREVAVPEEVTATWQGVVLEVENRGDNSRQDLTVNIGETVKVGNLEITVEQFLPSFTMSGGSITSRSNETENPAAKVVVKEGDVEVYSGWLFSLYPDAHPFQHETYGLLLKDFVKKN